MACWAQSQSAQVVDDRLQPPEGPSAVGKSGGRSRPRGAEAAADRESRRAQKRKLHSGTSHPPAAQVEEPKPEAPPPPPPTPAQLPANAPQVTYRNGLLTVAANNSTLGDILNLVRTRTGASIEYPAALSQERVAAIVGPAPAPQVLATLLNGTRFDYILLGMDGRPDLLQRAIITPRESGGAVAAAAGPAPPMRAATPPPSQAEEEPDMSPEETVEQPEEAPPPQAQPAQPQPSTQLPPNQPYPPQQPPGEQQQPGQPKTPEQLLQELQRMQQMQQQQIQQQQQQPQPQ